MAQAPLTQPNKSLKFVAWPEIVWISFQMTNDLLAGLGVNLRQVHMSYGWGENGADRTWRLLEGQEPTFRPACPGAEAGWYAFDEDTATQFCWVSNSSGSMLAAKKLTQEMWELTYTPSAHMPHHKGTYWEIFCKAGGRLSLSWKQNTAEAMIPNMEGITMCGTCGGYGQQRDLFTNNYEDCHTCRGKGNFTSVTIIGSLPAALECTATAEDLFAGPLGYACLDHMEHGPSKGCRDGVFHIGRDGDGRLRPLCATCSDPSLRAGTPITHVTGDVGSDFATKLREALKISA